MDKRLQNFVADTQQQISTTIDREEEELVVEIRACSKLDDDLRSEFHDDMAPLGTDDITVRSRTDHSNQGNETGQDVTIRFAIEDQLQAIDVIDDVVQIGKEFYDSQLERRLAREQDEEDSKWATIHQQKYFDDEVIKEFCLLYRGRVEF